QKPELRKSCLFILNDSQASRSGEEGAGCGRSPQPAPSSPVSAFGVSSQSVQRLLRTLDQNPGLLQRWAYRLPSGGQGGGSLLAGGGGRRDLANCPHLFLFSLPPKAAKKTLQQPWACEPFTCSFQLEAIS